MFCCVQLVMPFGEITKKYWQHVKHKNNWIFEKKTEFMRQISDYIMIKIDIAFASYMPYAYSRVFLIDLEISRMNGNR